jgi:4-hydroxybenzoate polyprenyltransferase
MEAPAGTPENPTGAVADAVAGNWVDRFAPLSWRPYLRLSRADRPVGTWLLYIPCLWGLFLAIAADPAGPRLHDLWIAAGCGLGAFLMRGAGCTWNDLTDRDFDAQVARTRSRPLPSGQVTPRQAAAWMVAQALAASVILFSLPWPAILLGIASLGLVAVYPFAKRFTWWPQLFLGLAFNWGVPLAWAARGDWPPAAAWVLWAAGVAWTLFYDTIYAHQDKEDDALIGVKSTARLFGDRGTRGWLRGFMVATVTLAGLAAALALVAAKAPWTALGLALAGVWALGWHLAWQLARLDPADPAVCLRLFRANRGAGLTLALFLAAAAAV